MAVSTDFEEIDKFADELLNRITTTRELSIISDMTQNASFASSDEESSMEDDLSTLDKMNVAYDFSAWNSFRESLTMEKQAKLKQSFANSRALSFGLSSFNEDDYDSDDDGDNDGVHNGHFRKIKSFRMPSFAEEGSDHDDDDDSFTAHGNNEGNHSSYLELNDKERFDNATWRMRLEVDQIFSLKYTPQKWEQKEMGAIINFLGLKNPDGHPEYLNKPRQQTTKRAISSIFFPRSNELQSVLLKRGPVLVDGEERELMLFTNGFILSRVELDTLVDLLLDNANNSAMNPGGSKKKMQELSEVEISERFCEIDTDHSGSLDRAKIHDFFRGIGMALSKTTLDDLMKRFGSNCDGTISLEEFESMMNALQGNKQQQQQEAKPNFWRGIRRGLKRVLSANGVTRKLDMAFQTPDIERIENMGDFETTETMKMVIDKELAPLTLAVYLKDVEHPLMVMCAKPGHVAAWVEAFRVCSAWLCPSIDWGADELQRGVGNNNLATVEAPDDWRCSTIDWGDDDSEEEEKPTVAKKEKPVLNWQSSTVDWGS